MHKLPTQPISVTIMGIFVLFITYWNVLRVFGGIEYWKILQEFGANPNYVIASGSLFALGGILFFVILLRRSSFTVRIGVGFAVIYFLWYWIDRLFIQSSPAVNTLFSLIFTTSLLLFWILLITSSGSKTFFNKEK